ncbi:MAG: erythromycin biosynthesis sensory transduction protein eryC1 [Candidatus Firestonebacteria bacterium RIFOXYC2_FULL_39_67]|nr:MAG: erythromycin biosynthesis sensory transduction protein eryC1 [Candidatus Firestonebacteria bacterium RIFOXYC2_FULL_39_67]OGF57303.1 MAG: erythromycin biosynthesis sensory transduction protein eryC1 [Candidatus Firestonebacteria bacterium RifOxyC12_full_39_7]
MIPFGDLKREYKEIECSIDVSIKNTLNSGCFILGENVSRLEISFAQYVGKGNYAVAVNSGTDALKISLMALGVGAGDYVITVPNTAVPTVSAISDVGAIPLFCDVDEDSATISVEKLRMLIQQKKKVLGKKLKAIIPVHLYGQSCRMDEIMKLSRKNGLKVIEDACQAHGAEFKGKKVGNFGDLAAFSFYPSKNLGAYGDGGIIITKSKKLKEKLTMLRNYGQRKRYYHDICGVNSRLDDIQAAILLVKLKYLDKWNKKRSVIAKYYSTNINNVNVQTPKTMNYGKHVFHLYVVRIKKRDKLIKHLNRNGIITLIHYPCPIHLQKAYKNLGYKKGDFPVSEKLSKEILSIPMFPQLEKIEQTRIIKVVNSFK